NRCALPVAIINICLVFSHSGILEWLPDRPPPGDLRNFVSSAGGRHDSTESSNREQGKQGFSHQVSNSVVRWKKSIRFRQTLPIVCKAFTLRIRMELLEESKMRWNQGAKILSTVTLRGA